MTTLPLFMDMSMFYANDHWYIYVLHYEDFEIIAFAHSFLQNQIVYLKILKIS